MVCLPLLQSASSTHAGQEETGLTPLRLAFSGIMPFHIKFLNTVFSSTLLQWIKQTNKEVEWWWWQPLVHGGKARVSHHAMYFTSRLSYHVIVLSKVQEKFSLTYDMRIVTKLAVQIFIWVIFPFSFFVLIAFHLVWPFMNHHI